MTNATCLSSSCHGNAALTKTIVNDIGAKENVPLFVDQALYAVTVHGNQLCVSCHNDINASGGAHGPVEKTYGGWARFSRKQATESVRTNEILRTRNYVTAASQSCDTCHTSHADFKYSAHATIFKHRAAHIDTALTTWAHDQGDVAATVGENYVLGDCNRCHATCSTCHFKSTIRRANASAAPITDFWDAVQQNGEAVTGFSATMSEYAMDWTTNVASHEFRSKAYFATDTDRVCEACHTGFQRPAATAYYWKDAAKTIPASVKATGVKRHPQTTELAISGSTSLSPLTGGTNATHASFACVDCHGTNSGVMTGNVHGLPGLPYLWAASVNGGDVQCGSCHGSYVHTEPMVGMHLDDAGTKVACIGCHTFGLARDFEFATGSPPAATTHEVFLDPETNEVRPVVWKNGHAIAWYSHNWQTLDPGTGKTDPQGGCARKCHYDGNLVGAGF